MTPIINIHVSEYCHVGVVNMYAKDYSLAAFGYVVELHDSENYLVDQLKRHRVLNCIVLSKVIAFKRTIEYVSVKLMSSKILTG
ncbi:MAG: hypothetical protein ACTS85_03740 [Arsenophonus sp. NC-PG7-MAG3]